ncbi:MAG: LAGLIDADG family homing endonuclease [Promethearchaeota archaeon]
MGEYDDDLFEEQHDFDNEIEEIEELEIENNFDPEDEEEGADTEIIGIFEPKDEKIDFNPKDENINFYDKLDTNFTPSDENKREGFSSKENIKTEEDIYVPERNVEFAEMTGIILGDGNIYINEDTRRNYFRIYSNRLEERDYNNYVKQQFEKIFGIKPRIEDRKDSAGRAFIVENKPIIRGLIKTGLEAGNKVKNQVKIPKWIESNDQNKIGCLRGLFDTDGSIYIRNTQKAIGLNFKNGSLPLIKDFKRLCASLDIKTQKIPKPKISVNPLTKEEFKTYQVTIENKSDISKFINTINPKKWEFRAETLGIALISHQDPVKRKSIQKELNNLYSDKKIHYTSEYKEKLRSLCQKYGYEINKDTIKNSIKNSLHDKRKPIELLDSEVVRLIKDLDKIL